MSPRELARYAVVNLIRSGSDIIHGDHENKGELLWELHKSFYKKHLRNLDRDDYITYLEQLVKEIDYFHSITSIRSYFSTVEKHSNNPDGPNFKYTDEPRLFEFLTKERSGLFEK